MMNCICTLWPMMSVMRQITGICHDQQQHLAH